MKTQVYIIQDHIDSIDSEIAVLKEARKRLAKILVEVNNTQLSLDDLTKEQKQNSKQKVTENA